MIFSTIDQRQSGHPRGSGYGFHLAVLLYFGLHFASLRRNHLLSTHLLAQIEGKPKLYSEGKLKIRSLEK
jgi:hypothetical protein